MPWTIDLDRATATHDSGLIVEFAPVPGTPGAYDGKLAIGIPTGLLQTHPDAMAIARLMREAGDAYIAARNARH